MVENFKITAHSLKRQLKISVYLPKNYNLNTDDYPIIYLLDGQIAFQALDNEEKIFDISSYLDNCGKNCICVGIHSPKNKDWRMSELNTFYIKDNSIVDPSLSPIFAEYIVTTLHDIIKQRYRVNNNVYLLGFNEGAIFNLYAVYKYDLFLGAGIFSPTLHTCHNYLEYLDSSFKPNKSIYLYSGLDEENNDLFYKLYTKLEKLKCEKLLLNYEEKESNDFDSIQKYINDFLNFIL